MTLWLASFCTGVIILQSCGVWLPAYYYIFVTGLLPFLPAFRWRVALACFCVGGILASLAISSQQARTLPKNIEGKTLTVKAYPCDLAERSRFGVSQTFCIPSQLLSANQSTWLKAGRLKLFYQPEKFGEIKAGFYVLQVKLKRTLGLINPLGFDAEKYYFQQGLVAQGSVREARRILEDDPAFGYLDYARLSYLALRMQVDAAIRDCLSEREHYGVMRALILGSRSEIPVHERQVLQATGTQHLLAISGLHVGIVMLLLYRLFGRRSAAVCISALAGVIYVSMVGLGPSAQRAWVMTTMALLVVSGRWPAAPMHAWWVAMALVLLLDPLSAMGVGFWFSFYVAAVLILATSRMGRYHPFVALFICQLLVMLSLVPLQVIFQYPFSALGLIANIFAIPWVSLLVLPLSLLGFLFDLVCPELGHWLVLVNNESIHLLLEYLSALSESSGQRWLFLSPLMLLLFASVLLVLIYCALLRLPAFALLLTLVALVFWPPPPKPQASGLVVMDSGQGLSVLMTAENETWVYDLGPGDDTFNFASRYLYPLLDNWGQTQLKGLIVSHGDLDHASGFSGFIKRFNPEIVWLGEPDRMAGAPPHAQHCRQGMRWSNKAMTIEVLFPGQYWQPSNANDHSCVIKVTIDGYRFLIMGDLEAKGELALVRQFKQALRADVLLGGHHGSNTASSFALLKHVDPDMVVFSAGYRNRFNHPHPDVLRRAVQAGSDPSSTGETGAIMFVFDDAANEPRVIRLRRENIPFWRLPE